MKKFELEPDNFDAPEVGGRVCCNVGGGKYSAVIKEVTTNKVFTDFHLLDQVKQLEKVVTAPKKRKSSSGIQVY